MATKFLDTEVILSCNEQWKELEEKWGEPVDLESEDIDDLGPSLQKVISSLDLGRTTFDSSILLRTVKKKLGKQLSMASVIQYSEFLQDLQSKIPEELKKKQFYYNNGQILSAYSVEEICDDIDDIFKSVDDLSSYDSTVSLSSNQVPDVESYEDICYNEADSEREKSDSDDVDRYIDEAFEHLNSTLASIARTNNDDITKESVTTLVKKFSLILRCHRFCNPRRRRSHDRFKALTELWNNKDHQIDEEL